MKFWGPPSKIELKEKAEDLLFYIEPQMRIVDGLLFGAVLGGAIGLRLGVKLGLIPGVLIALGILVYGSASHSIKVLRATEHFIEASNCGSCPGPKSSGWTTSLEMRIAMVDWLP